MRELRIYECDEGHSWSLVKDRVSPELDEEVFCPHGHEAVTLSRRPPVDEVCFKIAPAGWLADESSGMVIPHQRYWLSIHSNTEEGKYVHTEKYLTWDEIRSTLERLRGLSYQMALVKWRKLGL